MTTARESFHGLSLCVAIVLGLLPAALQAQSVGQVRNYSRVFSTRLPRHFYGEGNGPSMTKEHRETALECIEYTFGKVKEYDEAYGECCNKHHFWVTLENGDQLDFEDGCLCGYTIISPRFFIARDMVVGGLRVGKKPGTRWKKGAYCHQDEKEPSKYWFGWERYDSFGIYWVDENGIIVKIIADFQEC